MVGRRDEEGRKYHRRKGIRDRWLRMIGCISRHPITPILGLILGAQNLALGGIYLFGVIREPELTLLSRLLNEDDRIAWLLFWSIGMLAAGASQIYGVVRERWWCMVAGSNMALACLTFAATIYALDIDQGWVALISPALFTLALNAYLMILGSIESLKHPPRWDGQTHMSHHRDVQRGTVPHQKSKKEIKNAPRTGPDAG